MSRRRAPLVRGAFAATVALACLLVVSGATADRRATKKERRAVAAVVSLPPKCAKVRISTKTKTPRWASVVWKRRPVVKCEPFAADGVTVAKRVHQRWRMVTAGSSFLCADLYADVPRRIARDLGIPCEA